MAHAIPPCLLLLQAASTRTDKPRMSVEEWLKTDEAKPFTQNLSAPPADTSGAAVTAEPAAVVKLPDFARMKNEDPNKVNQIGAYTDPSFSTSNCVCMGGLAINLRLTCPLTC